MEDIIIVVWVAMIIIGSLINAANKRRAQESADEEQLPTPEEIREILQPAQPSVQPQTATKRPAKPAYETLEGHSIESESLEQINPRDFAKRTNFKHAKGKAMPVRTPNKAQRANTITQLHTAKMQRPNPAIKGEEAHELTRDFDLERAVVYSEILKPKFQEYE